MKEHQKKVEQDPDFIRKKLKLNADGTPREKVVANAFYDVFSMVTRLSFYDLFLRFTKTQKWDQFKSMIMRPDQNALNADR